MRLYACRRSFLSPVAVIRRLNAAFSAAANRCQMTQATEKEANRKGAGRICGPRQTLSFNYGSLTALSSSAGAKGKRSTPAISPAISPAWIKNTTLPS